MVANNPADTKQKPGELRSAIFLSISRKRCTAEAATDQAGCVTAARAKQKRSKWQCAHLRRWRPKQSKKDQNGFVFTSDGSPRDLTRRSRGKRSEGAGPDNATMRHEGTSDWEQQLSGICHLIRRMRSIPLTAHPISLLLWRYTPSHSSSGGGSSSSSSSSGGASSSSTSSSGGASSSSPSSSGGASSSSSAGASSSSSAGASSSSGGA